VTASCEPAAFIAKEKQLGELCVRLLPEPRREVEEITAGSVCLPPLMKVSQVVVGNLCKILIPLVELPDVAVQVCV
jgi:hypothetical protein